MLPIPVNSMVRTATWAAHAPPSPVRSNSSQPRKYSSTEITDLENMLSTSVPGFSSTRNFESNMFSNSSNIFDMDRLLPRYSSRRDSAALFDAQSRSDLESILDGNAC